MAFGDGLKRQTGVEQMTEEEKYLQCDHKEFAQVGDISDIEDEERCPHCGYYIRVCFDGTLRWVSDLRT